MGVKACGGQGLAPTDITAGVSVPFLHIVDPPPAIQRQGLKLRTYVGASQSVVDSTSTFTLLGRYAQPVEIAPTYVTLAEGHSSFSSGSVWTRERRDGDRLTEHAARRAGPPAVLVWALQPRATASRRRRDRWRCGSAASSHADAGVRRAGVGGGRDVLLQPLDLLADMVLHLAEGGDLLADNDEAFFQVLEPLRVCRRAFGDRL